MTDEEWLAELFADENCDECHAGPENHVVGPDALGNRHA